MTLPVPSEMTGTVGQILTAAEWNANVRDGINFLLNRPLFVGYQATAQSVPSSTVTPFAFDTTVVDSYSGHSNTTNNSRYTAQVAGWYRVYGITGWGSNSSGSRAAWVTVNGSVLGYSEQNAIPSGGSTILSTSGLVYLNVGDYAQISGYQSSGSSLSTNAGSSSMTVEWIHA